ncbi:myosin heavy chain, muscle [Eucalyptus grandis]|uniref:myosin heavy chain, muscle n=1 Tax=Eucalyptus grandis TaxID=71139 RepID=UPI00192F03C9|nr:myosin heavy chain, muscle [Eucalyptus grandis]
MAAEYCFSEAEMEVDESLGYPVAYAKLCRDRGAGPYAHGPPFAFTPYALPLDAAAIVEDLELMFPIINPKAKPTAKPKIFISLLWKQLNHLGNAGFDPAVIRVDPYGNVLYYHADSASPLAWDIDHWFPCSRGGLTVPSNLRILQWQACKKKHNKLELLVPWWDFQLGVSVNQFLSVFASSNSDFRHRAFSFLFLEGENEEINASQTVESHSFPQHFFESKERAGLAPAAIVVSRKESRDSFSNFVSTDPNRRQRPHKAMMVASKLNSSPLKENENPNQLRNPYQEIVLARDSLRRKDEATKMQAELAELDEEVNQMKLKNEEEKLAIQDLELTLIKKRRRAEKCRRLAEAQSSYRIMLEKMIRDAMHQSVIYKEQVRLNQAASNALTARLEAQKAICDASERELHKIHRHKDEIEQQVRPEWEQARKRSRMDDTLLIDEGDKKPTLYLPGIKPRTPLHKELRLFLEEEHEATIARFSLTGEQNLEETQQGRQSTAKDSHEESPEDCPAVKNESTRQCESKVSGEGEGKRHSILFPSLQETETEEDGESRKQRGKANVERWLHMLLENTKDELSPRNEEGGKRMARDEIIRKMDLKFPQREEDKRYSDSQDEAGLGKAQVENTQKETQGKESEIKEETVETTELIKAPYVRGQRSEVSRHSIVTTGSSENIEGKERGEKSKKEKGLVRSESARILRRIPSSPSVILGLKKGVDCIRKKPMVVDDFDGDENYDAEGNFIKSSFRTVRRAVKL